MFDFKKMTPLAGEVKKIMEQNDTRRKIEKSVNEQLGIQSRSQLPREKLANYDDTLAKAISEGLKDPSKPVNLTEEIITELSAKTLGSYVKKASMDAAVSGHMSGVYGARTNDTSERWDNRMYAKQREDKYRGKYIKRVNGISKASDKLVAKTVKEEQTIQEKDEGKPGLNFKKIENKASKEYGSKKAGERVAGAIKAKLAAKGKLEEAGNNILHPSDVSGSTYPAQKKYDTTKTDTVNENINSAWDVGYDHAVAGKDSKNPHKVGMFNHSEYASGYREGSNPHKKGSKEWNDFNTRYDNAPSYKGTKHVKLDESDAKKILKHIKDKDDFKAKAVKVIKKSEKEYGVETERKKGSKKEDMYEGIKEKIGGIIRREKAKNIPILQNRRDYAAGKASDAYAAGKGRKGDKYMSWRAKDAKKHNVDVGHPFAEENLQELSTKKLNTYIKKAKSNVNKNVKIANANPLGSEKNSKANATLDKRFNHSGTVQGNIQLAYDKSHPNQATYLRKVKAGDLKETMEEIRSTLGENVFLESAFGQAFSGARKAGKTTFDFGGKSYNTMEKGENQASWKANMAKASTPSTTSTVAPTPTPAPSNATPAPTPTYKPTTQAGNMGSKPAVSTYTPTTSAGNISSPSPPANATGAKATGTDGVAPTPTPTPTVNRDITSDVNNSTASPSLSGPAANLGSDLAALAAKKAASLQEKEKPKYRTMTSLLTEMFVPK